MRKVSERWVPHHLTNQMQRRLTVTTNLLSRFEMEENNFVSRFVASDETPVRSYEPDISETGHWMAYAVFSCAGKKSAQQGKLKLPMIFASDIGCGLTYHMRETGQTVNGMYCKGYIQIVLRRKHPELLEEERIILHDNAVPHISERAASLHAGYKWETPYPPNSLALSPCDFDLFPKLKNTIFK